MAVLVLPGPAHASEDVCPIVPDGEAARLMGRIEDDFRAGARAVQMRIEMSYAAERFRKTWLVRKYYVRQLWGVFNGDLETTRMLYVFTQPARLAGAALLFEDVRDPSGSDKTWIQTYALGGFMAQSPRAGRVLVPGTALTYADSRGFIPRAQYHFAFAERAEGDPLVRVVTACPRDESVRENLGYRRLEVRVNPVLPIVRQVDYFDLGGEPLKRYVAHGSVESKTGHFPERVVMDHFADGIHTEVSYTYYPLASPPDPEIYRSDSEGSMDFIARLQGALAAAGIGAELDREATAFRKEEQALKAEQQRRQREATQHRP